MIYIRFVKTPLRLASQRQTTYCCLATTLAIAGTQEVDHRPLETSLAIESTPLHQGWQ